MILGDAPSPLPSWVDTILDVVAPLPSAAADWVRNAIHGGGDAASTPDNVDMPEVGGEVAESVVGAGKRSAGKRTQAEAEPEDPWYENVTGGASVWPWLLGVGLLGGGAYLLLRRKRSKRGK